MEANERSADDDGGGDGNASKANAPSFAGFCKVRAFAYAQAAGGKRAAHLNARRLVFASAHLRFVGGQIFA